MCDFIGSECLWLTCVLTNSIQRPPTKYNDIFLPTSSRKLRVLIKWKQNVTVIAVYIRKNKEKKAGINTFSFINTFSMAKKFSQICLFEDKVPFAYTGGASLMQFSLSWLQSDWCQDQGSWSGQIHSRTPERNKSAHPLGPGESRPTRGLVSTSLQKQQATSHYCEGWLSALRSLSFFTLIGPPCISYQIG